MTRLKQLRLQADYSQAILALKAGVSLAWYCVVERSPEYLSPEVAQKLATALDCSSDELMGPPIIYGSE
jgi:transcriptional regulator with XRE-family HTH domain